MPTKLQLEQQVKDLKLKLAECQAKNGSGEINTLPKMSENEQRIHDKARLEADKKVTKSARQIELDQANKDYQSGKINFAKLQEIFFKQLK